MQPITKFLKAVFNFFVGDWLILAGVAVTLAVVVVVERIGAISGAGLYLLVAGIVLTLFFTLRRETHS